MRAMMTEELSEKVETVYADVYLYPAARAWIASVEAKQPASPGFEDARAAHALVDAAYRAAEGGAPVQIES